MSNYYIQGSGGWPFGLDVLSVSGQLFPSPTDSNLFIGYFGFPTQPLQQNYYFRIWEGLNTSFNVWYGAGPNNIAILRSQPIGGWGVDPNSQVTAKITFNKNTKAYSIAGTPGATSVNFISNNSSVIGSTVSSQNSASIDVYYNGWHWEKDFTFNTTSTVNYKIVLGGGSQYGDNNLDGVATLGENFIPLNVVAGNTYRFRVKPFAANLSGPLPTLEYEVKCLTCPKQNQIISTPLDIYNKVTTDLPFSLQATVNSNLPLFYSTSSPLFTLNTDGVVSLLGLTGSGLISIYQPGNDEWFPANKNVIVNIEEASGSCINKCLNTGLLYFTDDTFINLYNVTGSGLFLSKDSSKDISSLLTSPFSSEGRYQTAVVSDGQIYISNNFGNTWSPRESNRSWRSVAMSSDGQRQTAVGPNAQIYISNDFGETWTPRELNRSWLSVAISSNGRYQTAAGLSAQIYISNDFGETWSPRESSRSWRGIAMSSDGQRQVAVCSQSQNLLPTDQIYISNDFGNTWAPRESSRIWISVAMSSNGQYITAVGFSRIYISNDFGETWSPRESSRNWYSVAISSNGRYQTAVGSSAQIYISNDFGETWSPRESTRTRFSVSMSNNGQYQTAAGLNTQIYISNDFGETWSPRESTRVWEGIAMSSTDQTIININDSTKINNQNKFRINYGVNESRNIVGNYHKQLISIRPQKPKNIGYLGYFTNDSAWATYDVSTGMITGSLAPNNVFSYAIDIVASGTLDSGNFYYSGNIDVSTETGIAYVLNLEKNPVLYSENISTLKKIIDLDWWPITKFQVNGLAAFCGNTCEGPRTKIPPEVYCYTGELSDTGALGAFYAFIKSRIDIVTIDKPQESNNFYSIIDADEQRRIAGLPPIKKFQETLYSGYILYNNWQNGDYIKWDLYNLNMVQLYGLYHLGNYPPFPNTGFKLFYPNDFNSLDSLVDALNDKMDLLKNYPVWYPYECLKDTESGIFLTGELIKFYRNTGTTGSLPISHFNNRIDFISLTSRQQFAEGRSDFSYNMSIFSPKSPPKNIFTGVSYLIPREIRLEGLNKETQNWEILDKQDNFYEELLKGNAKTIPMRRLQNVIKSGSPNKTGVPTGSLPDSTGCLDVIVQGVGLELFFALNPLCPPILRDRKVSGTAPKDICKGLFIDENGNLQQTLSNEEICLLETLKRLGTGKRPNKGEEELNRKHPPIGNYFVYRTGWNLIINNAANANILEEKGIQGFDVNKIYDKYKVSLYDLVSVPEEKLFPLPSFFNKQINLYTLDKSGFSEHSSPPICSIGSDYIIDVFGVVPIEITGIWNYFLLPEESGIYRFGPSEDVSKNEFFGLSGGGNVFTREILEEERPIKFNKVSGRIVSVSGTGYLETSGYGVGTVYYSNNDYYFYNPSTQSVYFNETISGIVTGFGKISGNRIAIKKEIINQELLLGGRLNNSPVQYHEIISNGNFTSSINNVEYIEYDVLGFYPITGRITGNTTSGKLNVSDTLILTGVPYNDKFAYYPIPTGFTFSEMIFNINYNNLNNFNILSINNNSIIYHDNTSIYSSPAYFDSNETLVSIINNSPSVFGVSGELNGSNIKLYSLLPGESNNISLISNSTGVQIINYISGLNIYPRLYKIVTKKVGPPTSFIRVFSDPIMTGNIQESILGTGFYYSNFGSGNIFGDVSTFTGVRSFFDVWDIATGNFQRNYFSFLENNFTSGFSFYKNTPFGTVPRNINLRAFYRNYLNTLPQEGDDVADLIIRDLNNPDLLDTGIVFRLNGIK
jgi:photosystem II stability/assembly factor-like uncharacterized protein